MSDTSKTLESIFMAALEIESPEQRGAFVAETCGVDTALRSEVRAGAKEC